MLSNKRKRELKVDRRQIAIDSIEIGISSPDQILTWGERLLPNGKKVGLIKNSKTVNYKRFTPFRDGLFCERIFGPVTSFVCACGKKQPHSKVTYCEKCEVEYIDQRSRRYRLGYISLLSPVTHIWYLKGRPSYLSLFLGKRKKTVIALAYCNAYLIEHAISKKNDAAKSEQIWPSMQSPSKKQRFFQERFTLKKKKASELCIAKSRSFLVENEASESITRKKESFPRYTKHSLSSSCCFYKSLKEDESCNHKASLRRVTIPSIFKTDFDPKTKKESIFTHTNHRFVINYPARYKSARADKCTKCISRFVKTPDTCPSGKGDRRKERVSQLFSGYRDAKRGFIFTSAIRSGVLPLEEKQNFSETKDRFRWTAEKLVGKSFSSFNKRFLYPPTPKVKRKNILEDYKKLLSQNLASHLSKRNFAYKSEICKPSFFKKSSYKSEICTAELFKKYNFYEASSYTSFFYARQHTLPFLPTLVSHFYLRDALLNFIYSPTSYEDLPLFEYCHNKRWEPLRDVHRFMAHRTVNSFKNSFPKTVARSRKHFSVKCNKVSSSCSQKSSIFSNFHNLNSSKLRRLGLVSPCKVQFSFCKQNLTTNSLSLVKEKNKGFFTSTNLSHMCVFPPYQIYSMQSFVRKRVTKVLLKNQRFVCKTSMLLPSYSRDGEISTKRFTQKQIRDFYKREYIKGRTNCTVCMTHSFKVLRAYKIGRENLSLDSFTKRNSPLFYLKEKSLDFSKKQNSASLLMCFKGVDAKALYALQSSAFYPFFTKGSERIQRIFDLHNRAKKCLKPYQSLCLRSRAVPLKERQKFCEAKQGFVKREILFVRPRERRIKRLQPAYNFLSKIGSKRNTKRRDLFKNASEILDSIQTVFTEREGIENFSSYTQNLSDNETKSALLEEGNKSLLSGLELTAIREILSYTGGGALQQLLQQFNSHDLCKFLFAESQILRTIYETRLAHNAFSETTKNYSFNLNQTFLKGGWRDRKKVLQNFWQACKTEKSVKKSYDDFQNRKSDLQKKQILRLSRRIYKVSRRLKVAQLLTRNHRKPEWMILSHLPVLPPELRPILQMSEKVIVASDLNIMYQRVIYRNNRHLRVRFIDFHLVTAIQRLVQDAVDRLIENGKGGLKPYYTQGGRPLKSLSDILKGKKGRFRLNLLGKRVDFSGRSVIVVSPLYQIHECGLPKEIALELYHYFLLRQLIVKKQCASIVTAKKMIKSRSPSMWDILRELMYHHPVLLNRAPTLHRLGIQAFQPKLVLGNAILLHPLVCSGFNADFDGDQMGVHLPLSFAARAESWDLLWSRNNLLSPATGQPMLVPSQDMVLGFYYITASPSVSEISPSTYEKRIERDVRRDFASVGEARTNRRFVRRALYPIEITCKDKKINNQNFLRKTTLRKGDNLTEKIKIRRFLLLKEISTTFYLGQIKLHTPVWLYWTGMIESEEGSKKPLELRVQSSGLQQKVYERSISLSFFTKNRAFLTMPKKRNAYFHFFNKDFLEIGVSSAIACKAFLWKGERTHKTFMPFFTQKQKQQICAGSEVHYVRTTAGRVLMNNLFRN